jgi:hypothetical protein
MAPHGKRRMSAPHRQSAWMMLGQLLSSLSPPSDDEPWAVVYDVGSPPDPPVAWTISMSKTPRGQTS